MMLLRAIRNCNDMMIISWNDKLIPYTNLTATYTSVHLLYASSISTNNTTNMALIQRKSSI